MRVRAVLYVLVASIIGFATISVIPSSVEYMSIEMSKGRSMARLDSAEGARGEWEPLTAAPKPYVEGSQGWLTMIGLLSVALLLSIGVYFLARGWRG